MKKDIAQLKVEHIARPVVDVCGMARRSRETFHDWVARARELGFSEAEAPFVASARMARGPTTVATMRAYLRATYPWLYDTGPTAPPEPPTGTEDLPPG